MAVRALWLRTAPRFRVPDLCGLTVAGTEGTPGTPAQTTARAPRAPRAATTRARRASGLLGDLEADLRGALITNRIALLYLAAVLAFVGLCLGSRIFVRARLPRGT